jgi:hypothetical protein
MPGYSLVPVDYQPNFDGYSLVPVDYDPFAADGVAHQSQTQQAQAEPQGPPQQQPATGAGQPDAGAPATGGGPSGSVGGGIGPTGVPPTRRWIKARPKPLPLAATLIRRQQTLLHQTVAQFPCVMKMIWLTVMFMQKTRLAPHQQALRLRLPTVISRSRPLRTPTRRVPRGSMDIR